MIQKINYAVTRIFDGLMYPFSFIHEFWGILFLSILSSFVVLVAYKYLSSPTRIKEAKNRIKASIFAIRLYKDFWRVIGGSFFKSLFYTLKYFGLNFVPLLVILPILVPLFVQMDVRYGMRPFLPGEEVVIRAAFLESPNNLDVSLLDAPRYKPLMNPVFVDAFEDEEKTSPIREVNWKLRVLGEGKEHAIRLKVGDRVVEKSFWVGDYNGALSNKKFAASSWNHFIYPVEKLFAGDTALEYVGIDYPGKTIDFLGLNAHWLIYYLVLMLVFVLAFKNKFGVEF